MIQNSKLYIVKLTDLLDELEEEKVKKILKDFDCKYNDDVNFFLHEKAIEFSKRGFSQTYLVFTSYKNRQVLTGYYAIANKFIRIKDNVKLSKTIKKKLNQFVIRDEALKIRIMPCMLIGQLGKNYNLESKNLIDGKQLLNLACETVRKIQMLSGGKFVYLECEDVDSLVNFYENNGFTEIGRRQLDSDEDSLFKQKYLIQMIRYLK